MVVETFISVDAPTVCGLAQLLTACQPVLPPGRVLSDAPTVLTDLLANLQSTLTGTTNDASASVDHHVDHEPQHHIDAASGALEPSDHATDSGHVLSVPLSGAGAAAQQPSPGSTKALGLPSNGFPEHQYPAGRILWIMPDVATHPADELSVQVPPCSTGCSPVSTLDTDWSYLCSR